jgi:hypothetical protein
VRIVILSKEPARLAGIRMHPGITNEELAGKQKGTAANDDALPVPRAMVHARLTAVAYVEDGAHVHGLDGAYPQHALSWCSVLPRITG